MTRAPILAAGGIVLRQAKPMRIAVVQLRKRDEWVLPKGKLDDGETPRAAAEREVLEETGHDVCVHEFLGTLAYEAGGRCKIVHYWRMETSGGQSRDLMNDVRAVDWLPLDAAVARLSRVHEREFLAHVGPLALEAAALAKRSAERKPPAHVKRRRPAVVPQPSPAISALVVPPDGAAAIAAPSLPLLQHDAVETGSSAASTVPGMNGSSPEAFPADPVPLTGDQVTVEPQRGLRIGLLRKVRAWLQRAA